MASSSEVVGAGSAIEPEIKEKMKSEGGSERRLRLCNKQRCSIFKRSDADGDCLMNRWTPKWQPTSDKLLEEAEAKVLGCLTVPYESFFVEIDGGENKIRTIKLNPSNSTKTPFVLVHGFGSGTALWSLNLEALSETRPIYAFDILGFGRSSRPKFPFGSQAAEAEFVRSIEEWRKAVGLEHMILVGHSMGGFLSTAYCLVHPDRVKHLILLDPWGYPERQEEDLNNLPFWVRVIGTIVLSFNPLSSLRAAGPFGPWLVQKTRGDIGKKFASLCEDNRISQYIYHCNAQYPAGEKAFKDMSSQMGWAANPMIKRVGDIPADLPISMVFGSRSWMDFSIGKEVRKLRSRSRVDVQIIKGAGHHVYADKFWEVNPLVNNFCKHVQ
ncbi:(Lyso)-N-acylphosphatidylethanolamine lipase-like [Diadema antillarum]|uniref:(Lyso)-N-acylphosphatidylethanolamine lipase-like n=1 Tax=Diadema antillarum TaxID=105358 RepID=UPI003A840982